MTDLASRFAVSGHRPNLHFSARWCLSISTRESQEQRRLIAFPKGNSLIITNFTISGSRDALRHAWLRMKRYQNTRYTSGEISRIQEVPERYRKFVNKQSEQLRHCLIQAEEYDIAARAVSHATSPLLYYYSIMSLALAEILYKQDGNSSLDRARESHGHHGLELVGAENILPGSSLDVSAEILKAAPHHRSRVRMGTFELWHRSAREAPIVGRMVDRHGDGTRQESSIVIAGASDSRMDLLPEEGVSLLECYRNIPRMVPFLQAHRIRGRVCRSKMDIAIDRRTTTQETNLYIHPQHHETIEHVAKNIKFGANAFEALGIIETNPGYIISLKDKVGHIGSEFTMPNSIQEEIDTVWFCENNQYLNEFGLFYVAFYIIGNYARYYPDKWMREIEESTPLALSVMELIAAAEDRVPLLALGELSRSAILRD